MKKEVLGIAIAALLCSSCSLSFSFPFSSLSQTTSIDSNAPTSLGISPNTGINYRNLRRNLGYHDLPSTGNSKILVIPVVFSDCTLDEEELTLQHDRLENAFFGKSEDTYWNSVSSFYSTSSYGKLNISGKVAPYYHYSYSVTQANQVFQNGVEPTYPILSSAVSWYKNNNSDITEFDSDRDGFIDSVWLIYMEDYNSLYFNDHPLSSGVSNLSEFLWAYTYWYTSSRSSVTSPNPFSYAWASYRFMDEASAEKVDAHTYIHETGHLLGLDDYYNYDYSNSLRGDSTKPTGCLDMMDYNILDHNAYSKYLLGWIDPRVIIDEGTYNLAAFQNDGDAIIIPASYWYNTPLDEYLIIEFYTPTGLNYQDSHTAYHNSPIGFDINGFKVYHVDSRLGYTSIVNGALGTFEGYLNDITTYDSYAYRYYVDIANSNTPSFSGVADNRLISLLSPVANRKYFSGSTYAMNVDLFKNNQSLTSYAFHQMVSPFKLTFSNVSSTGGTITVARV